MVDSKLTLVIEAKVRDEVTRQMKAIGRETEQAGKRSAVAWKSVGAAIAAIGTSVAVARAARAIKDLSLSSIQVASDVEEMRSAFQFVFEDLEDDAERFARALSDSTNRSVFDVQQALVDFQLFFEPIGFAADEALRLSEAMVKLGVDLGSLFNVSPQEALERLRQGLAGSPEATRRVGIVVNEQILRQTALAEGIVETNRQLTQQERALAFVAAAYDRGSKAIGDAARTKDSFANRMVGLRAEIKETKVAIGDELITSIDSLVRTMGGWEEVTDRITGALNKMGGAARGAIDFVEEALDSSSRNAATMRGGGRLFQMPGRPPGGFRAPSPEGGDSGDGIFDLFGSTPEEDERIRRRLSEQGGRIFPGFDDPVIGRATMLAQLDEYVAALENARDATAEITDEMEALAKAELEAMDAAAALGLADPRTLGPTPPGGGRPDGKPPLTRQAIEAAEAVAAFQAELEKSQRLDIIAESLDFGFTNAFADFVTGAASAEDAWKSFTNSILRDAALLGGRFLSQQIFGGIFGLPIPGVPGFFANGGTGSFGEAVPLKGYANAGPIMRGPHVAVMGEGQHDEAVVPLPNGRSIPVDMKGGSGGGNVFIISSPLDSNSLIAAAQENPEAFAGVVMQEVVQNQQYRAALSDTPTRLNS